jgi:hypothetical protein
MVVLVSRRLEQLGVKIEKYNDTGSSIETNLIQDQLIPVTVLLKCKCA